MHKVLFKQRAKNSMGVKEAASVRNLLGNELLQGFGERRVGKLDYVYRQRARLEDGGNV